MGTIQKRYMLFWTNSGSGTPQINCCAVASLLSSKSSKWNKQDMLDTEEEVKTKWRSSPTHGTPCASPLGKSYISSVCTPSTCEERWKIGIEGEIIWRHCAIITMMVMMMIASLNSEFYLSSTGCLFTAKELTINPQFGGRIDSITHLFPYNELVHLPYIAVATNTKAD